MSVQIEDLELLDAVRDFALDHPHPDVGRFRASMRARCDCWQAVTPTYLAAADLLDASRLSIDPRAGTLMSVFERHKKRLRWEQSYKKEQGLVPDAMLAGYGFAEIIGRHGPFISERIRAGIGIWGPNIVYPVHKHKAEEVYVLIAGSAEFTVGAAAERRHSAGDIVYIESNTPHGFRTTGQSLVVYYLWQAGDLRQQAQFGE
jgi:mannose-6-phosphate isomerase-like protein (cupin superfamily)